MELPVSFLENMKKLLSPEEFNAYLDSYSEERVYGFRVNTNKLTPEEFEKICPFEIKKIPWIDNGYYYSGKDKPGKGSLLLCRSVLSAGAISNDTGTRTSY